MFRFKTSGTCAREVSFQVKNGKVCSISFHGGCDGNLKGIASLCEGMSPHDVISKLSGIRCGSKSTSCPDQLCRALKQYMDENPDEISA